MTKEELEALPIDQLFTKLSEWNYSRVHDSSLAGESLLNNEVLAQYVGSIACDIDYLMKIQVELMRRLVKKDPTL